MTLAQLKTYTVGVLKGWFANKEILDKFSESEDGELLYNGMPIGSGSSVPVTNEQVSQAVTDTLKDLNAGEPEVSETGEESGEEDSDTEESGEEEPAVNKSGSGGTTQPNPNEIEPKTYY